MPEGGSKAERCSTPPRALLERPLLSAAFLTTATLRKMDFAPEYGMRSADGSRCSVLGFRGFEVDPQGADPLILIRSLHPAKITGDLRPLLFWQNMPGGRLEPSLGEDPTTAKRHA